MIEEIIHNELETGHHKRRDTKHFIFNEWGNFGNGAGEYGFNQDRMGDPHMHGGSQEFNQSQDPFAPQTNMSHQHDFSYGNLEQQTQPCNQGFGNNNNNDNNTHLGISSPSFEPQKRETQLNLTDFGLQTSRDPYIKGSSIELPNIGIQIHAHGIDENHVSHTHFKTYEQEIIPANLTPQFNTGLDYCKAELRITETPSYIKTFLRDSGLI